MKDKLMKIELKGIQWTINSPNDAIVYCQSINVVDCGETVEKELEELIEKSVENLEQKGLVK